VHLGIATGIPSPARAHLVSTARSAPVLGRSRARNGKWVVISTAVETVGFAAPEDERTPLLSPALVVLTRRAPPAPPAKIILFAPGKTRQGYCPLRRLVDFEILSPPAKAIMPEEIKVKESDFYQLINAVDAQRVDLLKMKAEIARLTKMLDRMQPPANHDDPSKPASH